MVKTEVIKCDPLQPDPNILKIAAEFLKKGLLVAFPTETVYGVGVNLTSKSAVERLYRIKSRPDSKPLAIQIASKERLKELARDVSKQAESAIDGFWPGPLTVILEDKFEGKVALRMPDNKIALGILKRCDFPVGVPSANKSGNIPPRSCSDVLRDLDGLIDLVIDGGETKLGVESTIVDFTTDKFRILREGAISRQEIEGVLGK